MFKGGLHANPSVAALVLNFFSVLPSVKGLNIRD